VEYKVKHSGWLREREWDGRNTEQTAVEAVGRRREETMGVGVEEDAVGGDKNDVWPGSVAWRTRRKGGRYRNSRG
jgi:hypothetical protein